MTMPAAERSFLEPLSQHIYCDTDFLIAFLVEREPHHVRAVAVEPRGGRQRHPLSLLALLDGVCQRHLEGAVPRSTAGRYAAAASTPILATGTCPASIRRVHA